jgi:hypothetical protein
MSRRDQRSVAGEVADLRGGARGRRETSRNLNRLADRPTACAPLAIGTISGQDHGRATRLRHFLVAMRRRLADAAPAR